MLLLLEEADVANADAPQEVLAAENSGYKLTSTFSGVMGAEKGRAVCGWKARTASRKAK